MSTMGPTDLSPRRSGRRPSALAPTAATEQGSNKVAAAVADSAGGPIPSDSPAADASTLLSPPVAFHAMGDEDGITGSADTPGGADLFIDAFRSPGESGAATLTQAAAALGAPPTSSAARDDDVGPGVDEISTDAGGGDGDGAARIGSDDYIANGNEEHVFVAVAEASASTADGQVGLGDDDEKDEKDEEQEDDDDNEGDVRR